MSIAKTKLRLSIELVFGICISQIGPWKYITINNHKLWHFYVIEKCSNCSLEYNYNNKCPTFHAIELLLKMDFCLFCCFLCLHKEANVLTWYPFTPNKMLQISFFWFSINNWSQICVTCKKMFKFYRQRAHW